MWSKPATKEVMDILPDISGSSSLLIEASKGDRSAAASLVEETGPVIYGFIYARLGGQADACEDVLQSTYLEAIRSAPTFRGDSALSTWMCTIARRQIARHFESERKRLATESHLRLASDEEDQSDPNEDVVADRDEVIRALGTLPVLHRQALVLRYLDGMSVSEVAGELGRTEVQMQSLLQRARAGLKRTLEAAHE
ncbi:MAG TPA: RNA polymerase sigma factor [Actinomycetota bacterium]|nr:RNA polymerase sigma factor [Actinomycetota bacterium]